MCRQMRPAFVGEDKAHDDEDRAGEIGQLARDGAEAAEALLRMMQAPRREGSHCDKRQGETDAERGDHRDAKREPFQLQADEDDRERGRAGEQAAGQAEDRDLVVRRRAAREALLDVSRVGELVRVLVIRGSVVRVIVRMVMFVMVPMLMFTVVMVVVIVMMVVSVVVSLLREDVAPRPATPSKGPSRR